MKKIFNKKILIRALYVLLLLVLPVLALILLEFYTHVPWDLTPPIFFLNLAFYYLLYGILTFLSGSARIGYAVAPLLPMLFGLINYYVVDLRSSPIVPWDIYSIGVAASVAGNFEYKITQNVVLVVLGFLLLSFIGSRINLKVKKWKVRIPCFAAFVLGMALYVANIGSDPVIAAFGLDTTLFTPNVLYRNNGLTAGFLGNLKFLMVQKPDGYSPEAAETVAADYRVQESGVGENLPNVVVIMDEAFSDLSVLGEFETDMDYMPFIHSLQEDTVQGHLYVSVKGGNTANTEYEFLTGDSMAFLPAGSVPYQQYIKGEMPSVVDHLNNLGYRTTAIHPYFASGWARDKVYPWLGFDEALFRPDFTDPQILRGYVSDNSAFSKIIELFEEKEEGERLFTFEVTMQNHGGYSKESPGFVEAVHLTELESKTVSVRAAEKYLTLMLETDRAFEMLISYLERQEEDTIVLLFGDHQPSDYITNTILRLRGLSREESDDVFFNNYIVPFVMWANFDIEEEEVEAISVNYLAGLLFEKAGIPLSGYQNYLESLRAEIPAITANMVLTDGKRYRFDEGAAQKADLIRQYNLLTYNHLEDTGNRLEGFYE